MSEEPSELAGVSVETRYAAKHVLAIMLGSQEPHGELPGSFTENLILAAMRADPVNTERLRRGFPEYVRAVRLYKDVENGLEVLRAEAAGKEYTE